tara:strand:- start:505 stop:3213 length:2709 start_codon:yes stop_codon:yes gene_type:complete
MSGNTFNCGEFRPGKKPFISGGKGGGSRGPGTGGPKWITKTKKAGPSGPIQDSGRGGGPVPGNPSGPSPWWMCEDTEEIECGDGYITIKKGITRKCEMCTLAEMQADLLVPKNKRKCKYSKDVKCKKDCISTKPECGPITIPGGPIQPPAPPPLPPGPTFGGRPGGGDPLFFCDKVSNAPLLCLENEKTIAPGFRRECVPCQKTHTGCLPLSACRKKCVDVKPTCLKTDPGPGAGISEENGFKNVSEITEESNKFGGIQRNPIREIDTIDLYEEMVKSVEDDPYMSRGNSIYDPKFNLALSPSFFLEFIRFEDNTKYLNIFKSQVTTHVYWCLYNLSPNTSWDEVAYANLTIKDIANSIDPTLLNSLASLKYVGGTSISLEDMLEVIKYLLFSNRLDEFDSEYYIQLADEHSSHYKVIYESSDADSSIRTQAALGLVSSDATPADPEEAPDGHRPYLRKLKYLNEDLGVGMPVLGCDGAASGANLYNEGLQVVRLKNSNNANEQVSSLIALAEGGGYYLSASICDNSDASSAIAVDASSNLAIALDVSPETRANALNILEEDDSVKFTASVSYANSEFGDSYDLASELSPMYFVLDLSTVGEKSNVNPIVTDTTGTYTMVTSIDTINNHARSNGYNVRVLNIDYNDPFLVYASGTSSIDITTKDISFNDFMVKKGGTRGDSVILRRLPFSVVLNPGKGSKHNPLAGESELESWEDSITRNIYFVPDIDTTEDGTLDTVLEKYFTGVEDGTYKIGLMEPTDTNSAGFRYETSSTKFQNTYYSDGSESSTMPTRTRSGVATLVRKVDALVSKYEIPTGKITWFDIWKRFDATEFYNIQNVSVSAGFVEWLIDGGRGVKITKILSRSPLVITGLGDDKDASIDDPIYITNYDRGYDSSVDPPIQE